MLQPDVLVARKSNIERRGLVRAPLLAVEVLSPSTRHIDLTLKRARYEAAGCPSYWVIDPDVPSLIAWFLKDGRYDEVATVEGDETFAAHQPFELRIAPSTLID